MKITSILQICLVAVAGTAAADVPDCSGVNLPYCNDRMLCAVVDVGHRFNMEAKKRGLACRIQTDFIISYPKTNKPHKTLIHTNFNKLSKDQRKLVQFNLLNLGYYSSLIDGLYGKGTATALKAYNKEYFGAADLNKASNVKALIVDLLKEKPIEAEMIEVIAEVDALIEAPEPAPLPPQLDFDQVQASYDARDFSKAFTDVQVLAIQGDAEAQLLLGKMYADGRGTLQVATAAHMWFNLASMNGSDKAFEERKSITATMTPSAVETAQALAVKCIQSKYQDCGLTVLPIPVAQVVALKVPVEISSNLLKQSYRSETLLKRKQIQYALKKLGFYSSSVDGLWGKGTSSALMSYAKSNGSAGSDANSIFNSALSKVDVPTYFAAPKLAKPKKIVTKIKPAVNTNASNYPKGWRPFAANPLYSFDQAEAICEPRAKSAGDTASDSAFSKNGSSFSCNSYGSSTNCRDTSGPSGIAESFLAGVLKELDRGTAKKRVMKSCMAQYGWTKQ